MFRRLALISVIACLLGIGTLSWRLSLAAAPATTTTNSTNTHTHLSTTVTTAGEQNTSSNTTESNAVTAPVPFPADAKVAFLTFDDGPDKSVTPYVLQILQAERVKATFFVIGKHVLQYPDMVKQEYADGESIGNHTFSHDTSTIYRSPAAFWADFQKGEDTIYQTVGLRPKIFRCPGGSVPLFTSAFRTYMSSKGYVFFDWNVSSGDGAIETTTALEQRVESQVNHLDKKGARLVILMHDGAGHMYTAEGVQTIVEFLKKKGYQFGTLSSAVTPVEFQTRR